FSRDWSSDVCSSDLELLRELVVEQAHAAEAGVVADLLHVDEHAVQREEDRHLHEQRKAARHRRRAVLLVQRHGLAAHRLAGQLRSEERRVGKKWYTT